MNSIINKVQASPKLFMAITYAYLLLNGYSLFPIGVTAGFMANLTLFLSSFLLAVFLTGLYHNKPYQVLGFTFLANAVGFGTRFFIDGKGELFVASLSLVNVLLFLAAVPLFITTAYMLISKMRNDGKFKS